jgi:hypothetical protein
VPSSDQGLRAVIGSHNSPLIIVFDYLGHVESTDRPVSTDRRSFFHSSSFWPLCKFVIRARAQVPSLPSEEPQAAHSVPRSGR